jgi:hypothetical protein
MKTIAIACACVFSIACHDSGGSAPSPANGVTPASIVVSSMAFASSGGIAAANTCDGAGQSPELSWTAMPDNAKTIAIILDDPDAPHGTFTHWIVWNIAKDTRQIGTGGNGGLAGGIAGTNDFGDVGYGGPCPPKGQLHHYHLKIYGLDTKLDLRATDKRADVDRAITHHVVAQGEIVGTFQH